jgi:NCAIR mutase (PurE)-related protein
MTEDQIKEILHSYKAGLIDENFVIENLKELSYKDIDFAKLDFSRELRRKYPEVIFCKRKKLEHIIKISKEFYKHSKTVMLTKADENVFKALSNEKELNLTYFKDSEIILIGEKKEKKKKKKALVITAGTADISVANEAFYTIDIFGHNAETLFDVGVAGLHRLLKNMDKLNEADVLIVVAGMEGALASVVSSLTSKVVIAVPTSVGYGASFNGVSALLSMLNSCSPGICTMNIDNGFGAGYLACMIMDI